ncbi:MAG: PDZ domain-containing protein [Bacteroidia bacterium]|nr:PDZ domain-containing protein [Bacteroidia bacterium]
MNDFFEKFVLNPADFEEELLPCFNYLGWHLEKVDSLLVNEKSYGFKTIDNGQFARVALVAPYSPAWKSGIFNNDDIIGVNGTVVRNNLSQLLNYYAGESTVSLQVISNDKIKTLELQQDNSNKTWFFKSKIKPQDKQNQQTNENLKNWLTN